MTYELVRTYGSRTDTLELNQINMVSYDEDSVGDRLPSHEIVRNCPSKKWSICVNLIFGKCYLLTINSLLFHTD